VQSILRITDHSGKIIEQGNDNPQRVLDVQIARKINSILSDNNARAPIFGNHSALVLDDGHTVAAKTGTTSEFRDAWTIGYTPSLVVGVWAGNNDNHPMKSGADGVFVAAPIWKDYMQKMLAGTPNEQFIAYDSYNKDNSQNQTNIADAGPGAGLIAKITYYKNKTGKKISEKKAKKIDPEKVDQKIEYVSTDNGGNSAPKNSFSIAMPAPTDPMFNRWNTGTLPNSTN